MIYPNYSLEQIESCLQEVLRKNKSLNRNDVVMAIIDSQIHVYCGTSGYFFDWWFSNTLSSAYKLDVKGFYPKNVAKKGALKYYSSFLNIVEINSTFYKLPSPKTVKDWYTMTPKNFKFIVKFSKYATESKKLIDFEINFDTFWFDRLDNLKEKCAGVLIQMPPSFVYNPKKKGVDGLTTLERIVKCGKYMRSIDKTPQIFIEFRSKSWYGSDNSKVIDALKEIGWSMVFVNLNNTFLKFGDMISGMNPNLSIDNITTPKSVYVRFHGTSSTPYKGVYSLDFLLELKSMVKSYGINNIFFMFNNTDSLSVYDNKYLPDAIINAMMSLE